VLPSPEWKKRYFRGAEQQRWYGGDTVSIGIGQGYNAYTPLQMAHAIATLANDGVVMTPHLVKSIENSKTGERTLTVPTASYRIGIKAQNLQTIRDALVGVNKEGTSAAAFKGAAYTSAGKTGTAQLFQVKENEKYREGHVSERLRDHAWFIAYAPADDPRYAISVLVEHGGFGAETSAPIAREIMKVALLKDAEVRKRFEQPPQDGPPTQPASPPAGRADAAPSDPDRDTGTNTGATT
jgi:penicillin-binding protein 2